MTTERVSEKEVVECLSWLQSVLRMGDVRKYLAALLRERSELEAEIERLKKRDEFWNDRIGFLQDAIEQLQKRKGSP